MPIEPTISASSKSSGKAKRISITKVQNNADSEVQSQLNQSGSTPLQPGALHYVNFRSDFEDSGIPPAAHSRLFDLFQQIQKEFEMVYMENIRCKRWIKTTHSLFFLFFFFIFPCILLSLSMLIK